MTTSIPKEITTAPTKPLDELHKAMQLVSIQAADSRNALRRVMTDIMRALDIVANATLTDHQATELKGFKVDMAVGEVAFLLSEGKKVTAQNLAHALVIVTATPGYNAKTPDAPGKRTRAQQAAVDRAKASWSKVCTEMGIPALDNRGASGRGETKGEAEGETKGEAKVAAKGSTKRQTVAYTPNTAPAVVAEALCQWLTNYINDHGPAKVTGEYGALLRHFVEDVARLREATLKKAA